MRSVSYITALILISILFTFCNKQKKDLENSMLENFLSDFSESDIITVDEGLYIIKSGFSSMETVESDLPVTGDTIVSIYQGYLLSDQETIFDEAEYANPQRYAFKEDNVIAGWELSMGRMNVDETAKIIIHSDYAYKGDQVGLIPPFSTLIYEVRILDIIKNN